MKRTIIVATMAVVGMIGIIALFGYCVKLACILSVIENSLIVYGYYMSVREDAISRKDLFNMLNTTSRRADILELNLSMLTRQKEKLERKNIELQRKLIDAEEREFARGVDINIGR